MLIEFTLGNYRSFKEPVTLSLEAASISSQDKSLDENNVIHANPHFDLLTSAVIYGANASGKSNLVSGLLFMRSFVLDSARESQAGDRIRTNPFRLSTTTENAPSHFEIVFLIDNQKYRYGFEVSPERVESEWLYYTPTIREAELFVREGREIKTNPRFFKEGRGLEDKTRPNSLFLSVAAQFNGPISKKVLDWFRRVGIISGLEDTSYGGYTIQKFFDDPQRKQEILDLVRSLDLDINDILLDKVDPEKATVNVPEEVKELILKDTGARVSLQTTHTKYDSDGRPVGVERLDLRTDESEGTQKLFFLSGPVLDTLSQGKVLVVDEMEARMHPLMTTAMIKLFNSLETNPKHAQFVFTAHDTNLLDRSLFRRDQIWFVEKDSYGASHLYSLVEFKPRNDESFERNYLRGKYGAVPHVGNLSRVLEEAAKYSTETSDHEA